MALSAHSDSRFVVKEVFRIQTRATTGLALLSTDGKQYDGQSSTEDQSGVICIVDITCIPFVLHFDTGTCMRAVTLSSERRRWFLKLQPGVQACLLP